MLIDRKKNNFVCLCQTLKASSEIDESPDHHTHTPRLMYTHNKTIAVAGFGKKKNSWSFSHLWLDYYGVKIHSIPSFFVTIKAI